MALADSSGSSSKPVSDYPSYSHVQLSYGQNNYCHSEPVYREKQYLLLNEPSYILPHHYSSEKPEEQSLHVETPFVQTSSQKYRHYTHQQHYNGLDLEHANLVSSTSSTDKSFQCDKCSAIYDNLNQLSEHVRSNHSSSPSVSSSFAETLAFSQEQQPMPQYQSLFNTQKQLEQIQQLQQHQVQIQQQTEPQSQFQYNQQIDYNYDERIISRNETRQDLEEQAELLDLDSHKVQTLRYQDELIRRQQHKQQQRSEHQVPVSEQTFQHLEVHESPLPVHLTLGLSDKTRPSLDYASNDMIVEIINDASSIQEQKNNFLQEQQQPKKQHHQDYTDHQQEQQQSQLQQHLSTIDLPHYPKSPLITSTQTSMSHTITSNMMQKNSIPSILHSNQSWKSNEARRPKTYNCTACNKWFTSSGHLKRHYNTMLHKNAVKQSNQPDPANLPINIHHHPDRQSNLTSKINLTCQISPELSSLCNSSNLMTGTSDKATRDLIFMPSSDILSKNNININNKSQHQQHHFSQKQQSSIDNMASNSMFPESLTPSPIKKLIQKQHLPVGLASQILMMNHNHQHSLNLTIQAQPNLINSSLLINSNQVHDKNLSSPIMVGTLTSPLPILPTIESLPLQSDQNGSPPHITTISNLTSLLESLTNHSTTTISNNTHSMLPIRNSHYQDTLPSFGTLSSQHKNSNHLQQLDCKPLPGFAQLDGITSESHIETINLKEFTPEENIPPSENKNFQSLVSSYEINQNSSLNHKYHSCEELIQNKNVPRVISSRIKRLQPQQYLQPTLLNHEQLELSSEANENCINTIKKESFFNIEDDIIKIKEDNISINKTVTKEQQVTSTNRNLHYESKNELHKCIECDKVFNKACYLTQHNKSFHSGDKPFKCSQCGKRFTHEYLHAEHLQKHAGDKPYKCEICPKQFNHKTDLRRHMCLHTGEKPYACDNCGKGFIRKDHMMKHLKTHKKKTNHQKLYLRA